MRKSIVRAVLLVFFIVIGMFVGLAIQGQTPLAFSQGPAPTATSQPVSAGGSAGGNLPEEQLLRSIYATTNPSVVSIRVRIPTSQMPVNSDSGQPGGNQQYQMAAGSGWMYDTQGHIVTNAHVVQGTDQVQVTFSDGNIMRAKITGIDLDSDLAVIQAQGDTSKYAPVPLGDSDQVQVGDLAVAIGNPFEQAGTMTQGIISALHRTVQGLHTSGSGAYSIPGALQTDTALNPGNSGGPLLNASAQVIGVNEQIEAPAGQSSGISFAIPVNIVRQVVPGLIQNGSFAHTYLGISSVSLDLDINDALKLPENTRGALVLAVAANSPAAQGGIQAPRQTDANGIPTGGDVITAVDNQPIQTSDDLIAYLFMRTQVGQTVTLTVMRNGAQQQIPVKLVARPR